MTPTGLDTVQIIDAVYAAFADVPKPSHLHHSPYYSAEDSTLLEKLLDGHLSETPVEIIAPYASWAMTTAGDSRDYQYFLPRIYEFALNELGWPGLDAWLLASKLEYGEWRTWDHRKQEAVRLYFSVGFELAAARHPDHGSEFDSWLVGNLTLGEKCAALLKLAFSVSPKNAILNLASLIALHQDDLLRKNRLGKGIWDEVPECTVQELVAFFRSSEMKDHIFRAGAQATEEDTFHILGPALEVIEQL